MKEWEEESDCCHSQKARRVAASPVGERGSVPAVAEQQDGATGGSLKQKRS